MCVCITAHEKQVLIVCACVCITAHEKQVLIVCVLQRMRSRYSFCVCVYYSA